VAETQGKFETGLINVCITDTCVVFIGIPTHPLKHATSVGPHKPGGLCSKRKLSPSLLSAMMVLPKIRDDYRYTGDLAGKYRSVLTMTDMA
jgi:hypothetical protein